MSVYPNLLAEMARTGIPASEIAKAINVNPATLSAKINNANRLKLAEAAEIRKEFLGPGNQKIMRHLCPRPLAAR